VVDRGQRKTIEAPRDEDRPTLVVEDVHDGRDGGAHLRLVDHLERPQHPQFRLHRLGRLVRGRYLDDEARYPSPRRDEQGHLGIRVAGAVQHDHPGVGALDVPAQLPQLWLGLHRS
jgi:hypothetical protein